MKTMMLCFPSRDVPVRMSRIYIHYDYPANGVLFLLLLVYSDPPPLRGTPLPSIPRTTRGPTTPVRKTTTTTTRSRSKSPAPGSRSNKTTTRTTAPDAPDSVFELKKE